MNPRRLVLEAIGALCCVALLVAVLFGCLLQRPIVLPGLLCLPVVVRGMLATLFYTAAGVYLFEQSRQRWAMVAALRCLIADRRRFEAGRGEARMLLDLSRQSEFPYRDVYPKERTDGADGRGVEAVGGGCAACPSRLAGAVINVPVAESLPASPRKPLRDARGRFIAR